MAALETPLNLGNGQPDFIQINVGGQVFSCSKVTLTSFSGYFASMFSKGWHGTDGENHRESTIYFIDQDPEAFQILLSYMRNGFIKASYITETVLVQAEFLGVDSLIQAAKCSAYRCLHNHHSQSLQEEETCHCFDEKYGGILSAVQQGILPQSIQPSVRGHKEYAHVGISNDAVVIPTSTLESDQKLPCLMTKLILPNTLDSPDKMPLRPSRSEESTSSATTDPEYFFPTLIEALNWLHRNGFLEEEQKNKNILLHCCADIYNQQPVDPRMIQLFGHIWFSRRVVEGDRSQESMNNRAVHWDSPIIYNQHGAKPSSSFLDRREFAALISLYPEYQGDPLTREFVVVESNDKTIMNRLKVIDDAAEVGFATSRTMCIDMTENPVQWLATHGYTRIENEYSKLLQQLYREGSSKAYLWDNETISRIHVRVFSRDLIE